MAKTIYDDCPHRFKVGDNYGQSCGHCGEQLEGYGYGGHFVKCVHVFVNAGNHYNNDDAGQVCTYCECWKEGEQ